MTIYGTMWDSASGSFPSGVALKALYYNGRYAATPVHYMRGQVYIDVLQAVPASMLGFNADLSVIVDGNYWDQHRKLS
jgi:hypothetical protein